VALSPVALGKAHVTLAANDDVVEDGDATEVADLAKPLRELDVRA
jgi:hypothetical protein